MVLPTEIKVVETFLIAVIKDVEKSLASGPISVGDLVNFADLVFQLAPLMSALPKVPAEIKQLSAADLIQVASDALAACTLPEKTAAVAKAVIQMVVDGVAVYKALKE